MNNKEQLMKLFDSQIGTLKDRGTPEQILKMFQSRRDLVLWKAVGMTFLEGATPFIPVIPLGYRGLYDLTTMIQKPNKAGDLFVKIDPGEIHDIESVPRQPYYIYNVTVVASTGREETPTSVLELFAFRGRSPLTIAEVIATATHTAILSRWNRMLISGSCVGWIVAATPMITYSGMTPLLTACLFKGNAPMSGDYWGLPSCDSRG